MIGCPPELFEVTEHLFFLFGVPARGDEAMVADREARQPGGEFERTGGLVQGKDHERYRYHDISPTSGVLEDHRVGVHQVLYIGTDRSDERIYVIT